MNVSALISRLFANKPLSYRKLVRRAGLLERQLTHVISQVQAATDVTTNTDSTSSEYYVGTPTKYNTYKKQVAQLGALYANTAKWGCMIAKNIIDVRTAFQVGNGIRVRKSPLYEGDGERELVWAKEFMRQNNLDEEMPWAYGTEAEIEGKILFRFLVDQENKRIRVINVPWRDYPYTITAPENDSYHYTRATYVGSGDPAIKFDLPEPLFVYRRFGGGANKINDTPPKSAYILREMDNLDQALWDWRKINRLFSAPTPVIIAPDERTAKMVEAAMKGDNWTIGKLLVLGGLDVDFKLVGWKGDGFTTIESETQALAKTISGTTGVPVHFLGYPELLSNRDTAEDLGKLIALSTSKERNTWIGAYEELIQKAMILYNTLFGATLDPLAIDVTLIELKLSEQKTNAPVSKSNSSGDGPGGSAGDS